MKGITFFSAVDRKGKRADGEIASAKPAWCQTPLIEELKETIDQTTGRLERGEVPSEEVFYVRNELKKNKERYETIIGSKPKIQGKDLDDLSKMQKELAISIKESNFSATAMKKGTASPHEEARRMSEPCIRVPIELAEACGVEVNSKGEISRNEAVRIWQIGQQYL